MNISKAKILVFMCLILNKNGEAYTDLKEYKPGETLNYGVLDISNNSNWLPALQKDKSVPKFKQFLLRLHGIDDLVSFLLDYNTLSSGNNVVLPLALSTGLNSDPQFASTLYKELTEARNKRLNYFPPTEVLPVFISTDDLGSDNEIMMTLKAFQQTNIPLGIYIQSMDAYFFKTIGTQLSKFEANNMTTTHIIVQSKMPIWIFNYDGFVFLMDRVLQQINQAALGHKIDLTICMVFEIQRESITTFSMLIKFLYRWGEEAKCKVMALHYDRISDFIEMDSYKNSLFRAFLPEDTPLIATINYNKFGLLKEICSRKPELSTLAEIVVTYKKENQLTKMLNSIEGLNCGTKVSLKYNFYDSSKSKPPTLDKVLKSIAKTIVKHPASIRGIIVSLCGENCACLYNVPNAKMLSREMKRMKRRNITVEIDACSSWLQHNHIFLSSLDNGGFISKTNFDLPTAHDWLLEDPGKIKKKYMSWINRKNVYLQSSMSNEESCRLFESHWNNLLNIATLYGFSVTLPLIELVRFDLSNTAGLNKSLKEPNYRLSVTNFAKCSYFPKFVKGGIQFDKTLTGVTFKYEADRFSASDLALLFEFMCQSFNRIELVYIDNISGESSLNLVKDILESVRFHLNVTDKCEFYVNLENTVLLPNDTEFVKSIFTSSVGRAHINFNSSKDKLSNKRRTLYLLNKTVDQVGIMIEYDDAILMAENEFYNDLISSCNYVIIHINIAKILSIQYAKLPVEVIQEFGEAKLNPQLFYLIFWNLRAWKLTFSEVYPDVKLYARFAWPTTAEKSSAPAFLRVWKFIHAFSTTYEFPIFVYQAFDDLEQSGLGYGWWKAQKKDNNLTDLENYVEKQTDYLNMESKKPQMKIESEGSEKSLTYFWTLSNIILVGMAVAISLLCIISAAVFAKIRIMKRIVILTDQEKQEFELGMTPSDENAGNDNHIYGMRYDKDQYEIGCDDFNQKSATAIGKGQFGVVYKCYMPRFNDIVAVKMPNTKDKTQLISILREIKLMAYLGEHTNVVKLLGAYTAKIQSGHVFVVTEYVENGSLLEYLRERNKRVDSGSSELLRELFGFCEDIAKGMEYLAEKNVVHGDLAARNVLLDRDNVCKIGDFGLSKQLYAETVYVQTTSKPLPWAWLAVETLEGQVFTLKSDVWSMGVTFWEIFTLGKQPYVEFWWDTEFVQNLRNGLTLIKPELVGNEIHKEISKCWAIEPESRPHPGFYADYFERQKQDAFYMHI